MAAWLKTVLLLAPVVLIVFSPALSVYFVQDDFGHLLGSRLDKPLDTLSWFAPHTYDGFYRPLGVYVPIGILQLVFGLNPFWYHLAALSLHTVNATLLASLLRTLSVKANTSLMIATLYAVHPAHLYAVTWIAEFSLVLLIFWVLIFLMALVRHTYKARIFAPILISVALLTSEFAVVLPFVAHLFIWVTKMHLPRRYFLAIWFPIVMYLPLRLTFLRPDITTPYQLNLSPSVTAASIAWYAQRTVGLPDYAGIINAITNPTYLQIALPLSISLLLIVLSAGLRFRALGLAGAWWLVSLAPVLFLPNHLLSSYIGLALIGVLIAFALKVRSARFLPLAILLFLASAIASVRINWEQNWVVRRAKLAQTASAMLKPLASNPPRALHIQTDPSDSPEVYFALAVDAGPKVLTGNPDLTVTYSAFQKNPQTPDTHTITVPVLE